MQQQVEHNTNTGTVSIEVLKPSKADQERYRVALRRLHKNLETITNTFAQVSADLALIRERRLYLIGGYDSFKSFCEAELGKSRMRVNQLLQAHEIMRELMESGVPEAELPENERLCRELRGIPIDLRSEVWDLVKKNCARIGREPDRSDVHKAAKQLESDSAKRDRQQSEILRAYHRAAKLLGVTLAVESLAPNFRRRLTVELIAIDEQVKLLLTSLNSQALEAITDEKETEDPANRTPSGPKMKTESEARRGGESPMVRT